MSCEINEKIIFNIAEQLGEQQIYELLKGMKTFFTDAGSSKFHHSFRGGLARHSLGVYFNFKKLCNAYNIKDDKFAFRVSMLHDLCKVGTYEAIPAGGYEKKEFKEPVLGHGDSSIFIALNNGIKLSDEEMCCIKWHMGSLSDYYEEKNRYDQVRNKYIRLALFQTADYLDGRFQDLIANDIEEYGKIILKQG